MMKACECRRAKGLKLKAKNVAINGKAIMNRNLVDRTPPDSIAMSAAP